MKKDFEYCIFIGRFQPFHLAHYELLKEALAIADVAVVVLGSHNKAPNTKNPWESFQRQEMILAALTPEEKNRIRFVHMRDYLYNDNLWITDLQQRVSDATLNSESVALIGHAHDHSSYYLDLFPQWKFISMNNIDKYPHATDIRAKYFTGQKYDEFIHPATAKYMEDFKGTDLYSNLVQEFSYLKKYKDAWALAPFPPTFNTVDCVVIKSGHVLVVRRKGNPGKGLIALPGGFLNQNEKIQVGALRELKEETAIKISKQELESQIADQHVFDHPERSLRGRTITHAFLINLKPGLLPQVKGSDDADKAWWMPLSEFYTRESEFFEDHFHIISYFVNKF